MPKLELTHNDQLIHTYVNVFIDEINIATHEIEPSVLILDKLSILFKYNYNLPVIIQGYGRVQTLHQLVDEIDFLYNILSFFDRNGKILVESKQVDGVYYNSIVVSFFNIDTDNIEMIKVESKTELPDERTVTHLFWLQAMKEDIFNLIYKIELKQITSSKIKIGSEKFKTFIQDARANESTDSI